MLRAAIVGVGGRMGSTLREALAQADDLTLGAATEIAGSPLIGTQVDGVDVRNSLHDAADSFDVAIDFTRPESSLATLTSCAELGRAVVLGTTGFSAPQQQQIDAFAQRIAIMNAPNMSVGVTLCLQLLETAARTLGEDYDVEVVEAHHRHKVDAPSGTALRMGEVVAEARGRSLDRDGVFARQGDTGERARGTIGFATMRGGDIVGEHTVLFAGPGERVEISHRASSRMTFAQGALRAARWVVGQPPGRYDMRDVLALR